jgi:hypothetical protein
MKGLSSETRELLQLARGAKLLSEERRAKHKAALYMRLGLGAMFVSTKAAAAGTTWFSTLGAAKLVVGSVLLMGSGVAGYAALRPSEPVQNVAVVTPKVEVRARVAEKEPPPTTPAATQDALVVPVPQKQKAAPRSEVARSEVNSLVEETRLIRDADRALRAGNARRALTLLDEHATRFPTGALAPERSAERLLASCVLGTATASSVNNFIRKNAGSPLIARLKQTCAAAKR